MPNLNVGLGLAIGLITDALAIFTNVCTQVVCPNSGISEETPSSVYCTNPSSTCYQNTNTGAIFRLNTCSGCASGYVLEQDTYTSSTCSSNGMVYVYKTCVRDCPTCSDCTSDTSWGSVYLDGSLLPKVGYQKKTTRTCDCGTCKETTEYRCATGWYKLGTAVGCSNTSCIGCQQCPQATDIYTNESLTTLARGTSPAGSTAITDCYLDATENKDHLISIVNYYDTSGSFEISPITAKCTYEW